MKTRKGFTLVEVLLVVVIIAILAAIVIVAINPGRQISQANNTQRQTDVKGLVDAIYEYSIDNRGAFPTGITDLAAATIVGSGAAQLDICADLVPTYLAKLPVDPTNADADYTDCTSYNTGYTVNYDGTSGRITVSAPSAELSETISVQR